ncbi:YeiH family protein [Cellulomonas sp. PhB143]|uniref:YeiH family protein n=1 Tax=Cellulomonas sp. PhB143 TaxID=2485186 RepID=UPI000F46FD5C|nr:putative sulfate exporter family transporter [Cellulomonas sp. PhB143]ROS73547.1 putative integral membrane protein (TIGR00698 family) [Cellulomonas sp. PhB143]
MTTHPDLVRESGTAPAPRASRVPGLVAAVLATGAVLALARLAPTVSPLVLALALGAVAGSVLGARSAPGGRRGRVLAATRAGTDWTATRVLRVAVVLLGLQLSAPDLLGLGWQGVLVVLTSVCVTFAATLALGRLLRVDRVTTLLVATGFSICGAAAVSAMKGVVDDGPAATEDARAARDDALAAALALVTIYGSLAVVVVPWLARLLSMSDQQAGLWIGASTQEVAQVVAAAGTISAAALATATVAKLARVALLAPLVAGAGIRAARRPGPAGDQRRTPRRTPVPLFVVGFVAAVLVRSTGIVPDAVLSVTTPLTTVLFVGAMFAMGLGVDLPHLVRTGRRTLALGAMSWLVILAVSLGGVLLLT